MPSVKAPSVVIGNKCIDEIIKSYNKPICLSNNTISKTKNNIKNTKNVKHSIVLVITALSYDELSALRKSLSPAQFNEIVHIEIDSDFESLNLQNLIK